MPDATGFLWRIRVMTVSAPGESSSPGYTAADSCAVAPQVENHGRTTFWGLLASASVAPALTDLAGCVPNSTFRKTNAA